MNWIAKYLFIIFIFGFSCHRKKLVTPTAENIKPPRIDKMHFHIVKPPANFILEYGKDYAVWSNPLDATIEKKNGISLYKIDIDYGIQEEVWIFNYGRKYLVTNPENPAEEPYEFCEKLEITYDIKKKEYTIYHNYTSDPGTYNNNSTFYSSLDKVDSVLKRWGAPPLQNWK